MKDSDQNSADINILLELTPKGRILHYTVFKYGNCKRIRESEALDALNQATQCPKCSTELIVKVFVPDSTNIKSEDGWLALNNEQSVFVVKEEEDGAEEEDQASVQNEEIIFVDESDLAAYENDEPPPNEAVDVEMDADDETIGMEIETVEAVDELNEQVDYEAVEYLYDDAGDVVKDETQEADKDIWECQVCFERYPTKNSLTSHKRKHPELRLPTYCEQCDRHFDKGVFWKKHMEAYHSDEPRVRKPNKATITCSVCRVEFSNLSDVKGHMKAMHADAPRFHCAHCSKSYFNKKYLKDHILKKHFGRGSSFVCGICEPPKVFHTKYQIDNHFSHDHTTEDFEAKSNNDRKPCFKKEWRNDIGQFSCPRCLRIFNNRYSLGIHYVHCSRKQEPVGKIPTCDICKKTFTT